MFCGEIWQWFVLTKTIIVCLVSNDSFLFPFGISILNNDIEGMILKYLVTFQHLYALCLRGVFPMYTDIL